MSRQMRKPDYAMLLVYVGLILLVLTLACICYTGRIPW